MQKKGVFPGSFDPFTKGHEAIVRKAVSLFDEVIIGIGINQQKNYLFDLEKRIVHIQSLFSEYSNIKIETYQTLTVDFCKKMGAAYIIRGLRDVKDFEYERSIAHMNEELSGIETIFFITELKYSAINASIVREIYKNNGSIDSFVTNSSLLV